MTVALATSALSLGFIPAARAHTCADHHNCPATGCKEGEDHSHRDYNDDPYEDGYCESTSTPPPDPESCEYYGVRHPPTVCKLLGESPVVVEIPPLIGGPLGVIQGSVPALP